MTTDGNMKIPPQEEIPKSLCNQKKADNSQIDFFVKAPNSNKWSVFKEIIIPLSFILSISSFFMSLYFSRLSADISLKGLTPKIILTEKKLQDGQYIINLWNVGPGVAHDVIVDTYLDYVGDTGITYLQNTIDAAAHFQNKTQDQINNFRQIGYKWIRNPPAVLPAGYDVGYSTDKFDFPVLNAFIAEIKYKDSLGNSYYSYWKDIAWKFGEGPSALKIKYNYPNNYLPTSLIYWKMLEEAPHDSQTLEWLEIMANKLKSIGFENAEAQLKDPDKKKQIENRRNIKNAHKQN